MKKIKKKIHFNAIYDEENSQLYIKPIMIFSINNYL